MRKILIFGCTKVTEAIVPLLCSDISIANEICIASGDKADCDVLRKKYSDLPVRITTARADVNNEAGTKMMLSIIQPDLIVNLEPAPLSTKVMKIALYQGADYIDASLDEWNKGDFLSKQFELFGEFREKGITGIVGCVVDPSLITTIIRKAAEDDFDKIEEVDVFGVNMHTSTCSCAIKKLLESPDLKAKQEKAVCIEAGEKKEYDPLAVKIEGGIEELTEDDLFLLNDPITEDIRKEIPDIPTVRYFSTYKEKSTDVLDTLRDCGMLSDVPVEVAEGVKIAPIDFLAKVMPAPKEEKITGNSIAAVVITGKKDGADKSVLMYSKDDNEGCIAKNGVEVASYLDALMIVAGIRLICLNKWKKPGVFTASAFDPQLLIDALKKLGLRYSVTDTQPIKLEIKG